RAGSGCFAPQRLGEMGGAWRSLIDAVFAGLWAYWVLRDEVVALPRPVLHIVRGQLHCATGPAVSWGGRSAGRLWFLNGVRVSRMLVETSAEALDARLVETEPNAEVRREIVRKIGMARLLRDLGARVVDREGDTYELLVLGLSGITGPFFPHRR